MKKLPALGLLAALCTSCLPVPFDLAISQAAATARKMTRDNGPLLSVSQGIDPSAHDFVFCPSVSASGLDYSYGFVLSQRDLSVTLAFARDPSSSGNYSIVSQYQGTIANPDAHAPPFAAWPAKSGPAYVLGFAFDAISPAANSYSVFWGNPATLMVTPVTGSGMNTLLAANFGLNAIVLGASVSADPSGTYDMLHWLATQSGVPGSWVEYSIQAGSTGLTALNVPRGATPYPLAFLPTAITRCTYFYDENQSGDPARSPNRSFASWWDSTSNSWVSHAWWEQPAGTFHDTRLSANHRLDALLSTGQLLSTEGGTGRLYDREGDLLATFPLGNLAYMAEEYVGGVPRCYFSQCLIFDQRLHFNVYWIRTDQLSTLGS